LHLVGRRFTQVVGALSCAITTSAAHALAIDSLYVSLASEDGALLHADADVISRTLTESRAAQFASSTLSVRFLRVRAVSRSPPLNGSGASAIARLKPRT
jgi:hypothetical protein